MDDLLVIDMQQAYFKDRLQHDVENIIKRINQVITHFRNIQSPIVFIQHDGDGKETAAPHTEGWEVYSGLSQHSSDIKVRKTLNDAFAKSNLDTFLKKHSINRLIMCGWATDFCVDATIRSAVSRGYDVTVLEDCHTLTDRPHLKAQMVIKHHNWVWRNMITDNHSIQVMPAQAYIHEASPSRT